jgi:hypothetical protein
MEGLTRRKLTMAARALAFAQAHPATDAGYTALVTRLQGRLADADALAIRQHDGHASEMASHARRDAVRRSVQQVQLQHLVRVAKLAARDHPELDLAFVYPAGDSSEKAFVTAAKALLASALEQKELLVSLGLGETLLDELTAAIAQYGQFATESDSHHLDHVGARAELNVAADDCLRYTRVLDGIYRNRFRLDADTLAAWESAKNVMGPLYGRTPTEAPTPAAPPQA